MTTCQDAIIARLEGLSCPDWTVMAVASKEFASLACDNDYTHGSGICFFDRETVLCVDCMVDVLRQWYLVQGARITVVVYR